MQFKTHVAIAIFFILIFLPYVENKVSFAVVALIATIIPDLDTARSRIGSKKIFRILQFFVKHRGFIHSFTVAFSISMILAFFFPIAAFGFFLGYGVHLVSDSFTKEGIVPFWPINKRVNGFFITGGKNELFLFMLFILGILFLLLTRGI